MNTNRQLWLRNNYTKDLQHHFMVNHTLIPPVSVGFISPKERVNFLMAVNYFANIVQKLNGRVGFHRTTVHLQFIRNGVNRVLIT